MRTVAAGIRHCFNNATHNNCRGRADFFFMLYYKCSCYLCALCDPISDFFKESTNAAGLLHSMYRCRLTDSLHFRLTGCLWRVGARALFLLAVQVLPRFLAEAHLHFYLYNRRTQIDHFAGIMGPSRNQLAVCHRIVVQFVGANKRYVFNMLLVR